MNREICQKKHIQNDIVFFHFLQDYGGQFQKEILSTLYIYILIIEAT